MKRVWLAAYTRPRAEKRLANKLESLGIEVYLPLKLSVRQWSDRKKKIFEPIISSYIFVYVNEIEQKSLLFEPALIRYVAQSGAPAVIPEFEIDRMKRFLNDHKDVNVEAIEFQLGKEYEIRNSGLMGEKGELISVMGNKVRLRLRHVGFDFYAEVSKDNLV